MEIEGGGRLSIKMVGSASEGEVGDVGDSNYNFWLHFVSVKVWLLFHR